MSKRAWWSSLDLEPPSGPLWVYLLDSLATLACLSHMVPHPLLFGSILCIALASRWLRLVRLIPCIHPFRGPTLLTLARVVQRFHGRQCTVDLLRTVAFFHTLHLSILELLTSWFIHASADTPIAPSRILSVAVYPVLLNLDTQLNSYDA